MKAIKIFIIALIATFAFNTVNAQTTAPAKPKTEKTHKKGHKKHHHKKHTKMVAVKK